ncbi:uncharacterized protein ALTATR162_LOCUS89 [Alternaria atra]|uniref:Uncharacterized protein n=1 Tax=Alternaria atra TaxID=119953 RepID=A0A8J2MVJ8_9PLEO|nr:uncharacterized protein ALTATR162_LOCUS89 [Alternaria atra]CAG5137401.1 unnamed protein product [Alternaria atra]
MPSPNQQHTTTLWLWPTGLFPRRIIYYLRAKNISSSMLHEKNIHLIPVVLDKGAPTPDLVSRPGLEARPAETSLPVLRITYADDPGNASRSSSSYRLSVPSFVHVGGNPLCYDRIL